MPSTTTTTTRTTVAPPPGRPGLDARIATILRMAEKHQKQAPPFTPPPGGEISRGRLPIKTMQYGHPLVLPRSRCDDKLKHHNKNSGLNKANFVPTSVISIPPKAGRSISNRISMEERLEYEREHIFYLKNPHQSSDPTPALTRPNTKTMALMKNVNGMTTRPTLETAATSCSYFSSGGATSDFTLAAASSISDDSDTSDEDNVANDSKECWYSVNSNESVATECRLKSWLLPFGSTKKTGRGVIKQRNDNKSCAGNRRFRYKTPANNDASVH